VYEAAGIAGVDPGPLTPRQVYWMAHGRQRYTWMQFAQVSWLTALTIHRKKGAQPPKLEEFTPYVVDVADEQVSFKSILKRMKSMAPKKRAPRKPKE
jgi:hypothetical protein